MTPPEPDRVDPDRVDRADVNSGGADECGVDAKSAMRRELRSARAARDAAARAADAERLVGHLLGDQLLGLGPDVMVAAYVPAGTEPGSVEMLDALRRRGARVIVPVIPPGEPAPLLWAEYRGPDSLMASRFGIPAPAGPARTPNALTDAQVVLIPALGVDRTGVRLGRGAGYYDRSLHAATGAVLVAVVYDDEILDALPHDDYDHPVTHVLTPSGGVRQLPL